MRFLPLVTAAALLAGTGLANAQATNFSVTPGDAKSLSGSGTDVRDWREVEQRRAMEGNRSFGMHQSWSQPGYNSFGMQGWSQPGWNSFGSSGGPYAYNDGWNAFGSGVGVQVGPFGAGVGFNDWNSRHYDHRYHNRQHMRGWN